MTTLDAKLQTTAYNALGDEKGAVVVMEADTGKILAMVSKRPLIQTVLKTTGNI